MKMWRENRAEVLLITVVGIVALAVVIMVVFALLHFQEWSQ